MRKALIFVNNTLAGVLEEKGEGRYSFHYETGYHGAPVQKHWHV